MNVGQLLPERAAGSSAVEAGGWLEIQVETKVKAVHNKQVEQSSTGEEQLRYEELRTRDLVRFDFLTSPPTETVNDERRSE